MNRTDLGPNTGMQANLSQPDSSSSYKPGTIRTRGFWGLFLTQFLGAMNDNMFRWLIVPVGKDIVGPENAPIVLALGGAVFVLPFLVLVAPAGYLGDRFSKRTTIIGCKIAELVIMILGFLTLLMGNVTLMFIMLTLMGTQSALFSPSKYGIIPEIVETSSLSKANGLIGLSTVGAICAGVVAGGLLYWATQALPFWGWVIAGAAPILVALIGWMTSLIIPKTPVANPQCRFPVNLAKDTVSDLSALFTRRNLLGAALATSFFWGTGALVQLNIDQLVRTEIGLPQQYVGPMLATLALGVGIGSVLAGLWSAGRIEVGLSPFGAITMGITACLVFVPWGGQMADYRWICGCLLVLGIGGGLYDIPMVTYIQKMSPENSRGRILAAANFLTFGGMLLSSGVFYLLSIANLSPREIFLAIGLVTLPLAVYIIRLIPIPTLRVVFWTTLRLLYRIRVEDVKNLPEKGGVLLVCNHVTWLDGAFVFLSCPRPVRMFAYADYINRGFVGWLARKNRAIEVHESRESMLRAIRAARQGLKDGDVVCIFPEGQLTRTGLMNPFQKGYLTILKGTGAPVIPMRLHGLWGSIFSFKGGKFFWKTPERWPYPVSILYGKPMPQPVDPREVRRQVELLGLEAMHKNHIPLIPIRRFLRNYRRKMRRTKVADSTGASLTGAGLLIRSLVLRRLLRREVLAKDEKTVGILIPPTVAGAVVNAALGLDGRTSSNLNYSVKSPRILNQCLHKAGIRHVLTSRKVMERFPDLKLDAQMVCLEDFVDQVRLSDKLIAAFQAWLLPACLLERILGLHKIDLDDVLTIIFTSGSTGDPKGAMLTHRNITENINSFNQAFEFTSNDVMIGVLPFFHSFGYTATLWSMFILDIKAAYHTSPLEPRPIGKLCRQYGGTVMTATPTFLRSYIKRIPPEDFETLNLMVMGAEKLPISLADAYEKKYGVRPIEGYGTTEMSPVVAANVPLHRLPGKTDQITIKDGTIGRPLPGISAKILDLDTGEEAEIGQSGMLWVTGPNVMKGYINDPEQTAEVLKDGWYKTGDVAMIDEDGFITITGRISRFSKIGGEMVPHVRIEDELIKILGLEEAEEVKLTVTAVPDPRKGERLIVLHTGLEKTPKEICNALADAGFTALWIPSVESFRQVDAIPVLGSGKVALKEAQLLAEQLFHG